MPHDQHAVDRSGLMRSRRGAGVDPGASPAVDQGPLLDGAWSPWSVESRDPALDLAAWAAAHRAHLDRCLLEHGAIRFRGFANDDAAFRRVVDATIPGVMNYREGATPRTALGAGIYTSTEFPRSETIHLHNELSYVRDWPMRLAFACRDAATSGGATPLADVRRVLARLSPELRTAFAQRGWRLVRRYGDGLGPAWRRAFGVDTLDAVADYCAAANIALDILDDEHIRTHQTRPAIHRHPITQEAVWFNHVAFWHPSSLPPATRVGLGSDTQDLPFDTLWGDGETIPDDIVAEIRQAFDAETVRFPWRRGDVLLIDNMLVAHGREPFEGERRVLAAMGTPFSEIARGDPAQPAPA